MTTASASPQITLTLSISPTTYSFDSPTAPTLSLAIESRAHAPLTILTYGKPLHPKSALTRNGFIISDVTADNSFVPQATFSVHRPPFSLIRDKEYLLTLQPNEVVTVSTSFCRGGGDTGARPQPREVVKRGREVDDEGRETSVRRPTEGTGVDGLEQGHRYRVDISRGSLEGLWWRWGTQEEIVRDAGTTDVNLATLRGVEMPLDVLECEGCEFEVV